MDEKGRNLGCVSYETHRMLHALGRRIVRNSATAICQNMTNYLTADQNAEFLLGEIDRTGAILLQVGIPTMAFRLGQNGISLTTANSLIRTHNFGHKTPPCLPFLFRTLAPHTRAHALDRLTSFLCFWVVNVRLLFGQN